MRFPLVNTSLYTEPFLREFSRWTLRPLFRTGCVLLGTLTLLGGILLLIWYEHRHRALCLFLLAASVYFWWQLFSAPKRLAARRYHSDLDLYHEPVTAVTAFSPDGFTHKNLQSGGMVTLAYRQIRRVVQTRSMVILLLEKHMAIPLARDGFGGESCASFLAFLHDRRADLKIKF
ncbi:YcxB family protein [Feifania hominis]|uniref:YcxB family protein n=1 Tax=Feifania hominis TaxID=2763660 RepID=A0A926DF54_9FIRM|nr:YcxB family protein [Feifania hominis]MBC8535890.1 YcxB family protein [Feifania hominis]